MGATKHRTGLTDRTDRTGRKLPHPNPNPNRSAAAEMLEVVGEAGAVFRHTDVKWRLNPYYSYCFSWVHECGRRRADEQTTLQSNV